MAACGLAGVRYAGLDVQPQVGEKTVFESDSILLWKFSVSSFGQPSKRHPHPVYQETPIYQMPTLRRRRRRRSQYVLVEGMLAVMTVGMFEFFFR